MNLEVERLYGSFVRQHIRGGLITACHDLSDGGCMVSPKWRLLGKSAQSNTCLNSGDAWYFGRTRHATSHDRRSRSFLADARANDIPAILIGRTGGNH